MVIYKTLESISLAEHMRFATRTTDHNPALPRDGLAPGLDTLPLDVVDELLPGDDTGTKVRVNLAELGDGDDGLAVLHVADQLSASEGLRQWECGLEERSGEICTSTEFFFRCRF